MKVSAQLNMLVSVAAIVSLVVLSGYKPASASEDETELEAELDTCATCTTDPGAKGEAQYEQELASDGITVKEAKIQAQIHVPIPNSLGITDVPTAQAAVVTLNLMNTSVDPLNPYAVCTMVYKKTGKGTIKNKAMYALKVQTKLKKGVYVGGKKQLGACEDVATPGVSVVPAVQDGDLAVVVVNGTTILAGTFGGEEEEGEEEDD